MTTTTCRECGERFPLNRRSNQHGRASGAPHKGTRFCSPACKQLAYRKRNAKRLKSAPGTATHATVTRSPQVIENIGAPDTDLTDFGAPIRAPERVIDAEVWGNRHWESKVSSGGVPIEIGRLRPRALV